MIVKYKNTDFFLYCLRIQQSILRSNGKICLCSGRNKKDATQDVLNLYNLNESAITYSGAYPFRIPGLQLAVRRVIIGTF